MAESSIDPALPKEVRLRDLRPTEAPVIVLGRVVTASRREITRRSDGGRRPVLSGLLSDGTATVRFTWWDPPPQEIDRGTVLRAGPVQIREWQGRPEISFTWRTRVVEASEAELPRLIPEELPARRVADLSGGDEGFRLEVRVLRAEAKPVTVGEERRLVHEGLVADDTGPLAFTAWTDFHLTEGEAVRIAGGYVRAFRGRPQLVLDERSHVDRIPGAGLPPAAAFVSAPPRAIALLEAERGSDLAVVEGLVVGLLPPSGLVYRCPSCRRSVTQGLCRLHGAVEGVPDLRARIALDDGTGALTVHADRAQTERLGGRTLEECLRRLRDTPDPGRLEEELFEALFGTRLRVTGRASVDDFGLTLFPREIAPVTPGVGGRAPALRDRLAREGRP